MDPLSRGEKAMNWVMKHVMPWFILVGLVVAIGCFVMAVISSV